MKHQKTAERWAPWLLLLLIVGLGLILAGANFLTDGSAAVAQRFRVPEFIIGLTIVAVGTSMPELVVSVLSAAAGNSDVAIGNVVGSNIFNVFVILGICALIRPLVLTKENIRRDIPFGMAASLVLLAVTSDRLVCAGATDRIGRPDGIVMLALYIGLMWYMIRTTKRQRSIPGATTGMNVPVSGAALKNGAQHAEGTKKPIALWLAGVMIAGGLAGLVFGGEMFLKSATAIARTLGISESVIAITLVAGGTSLPELASSVVSLLKGKAEMALGNVIGSNIANILLILGISATIHPLTMGGITLTDILVAVLSSLLLGLSAWLLLRNELHGGGGMMIVASVLGGRMLAPLVQVVSQWQSVVNVRDSWVRLEQLLSAVPARPRSMAFRTLRSSLPAAPARAPPSAWPKARRPWPCCAGAPTCCPKT